MTWELSFFSKSIHQRLRSRGIVYFCTLNSPLKKEMKNIAAFEFDCYYGKNNKNYVGN